MLYRLRRVVAFVLLALLPLQATAVMTICPQSRLAVTAAMQERSHCLRMNALFDISAQRVTSSADIAQADPTAPQQSCSDTSACAMCTVVASWPRVERQSNASWRPALPLVSLFTSFVPEGPLRPPSVLA